MIKYRLLFLLFSFSLLHCGSDSSNSSWQPYYFQKQSYLPLIDPSQISGGFNPFVQHQEHLEKAFTNIVEKYPIKHKGYHTEAIYRQGDLSEVIEILLKNLLPDRNFELLPEIHNKDSIRYEFTLKSRGESFHFKTTSRSQQLELIPNLKELNRLARRFYPGFQFSKLNYPNDHRTIIAFAEKKVLEQAVAEGFPCTIPQSEWQGLNWQKGIHIVVELDLVPSEDQMKELLLKNLDELKEKGIPTPKINPAQLYLTDMSENGILHVVVDGVSPSLNLIKGNSIQCDDRPWGRFLAYCLANEYPAKIMMLNQAQRKWKRIDREFFLQSIEELLMANKPSSSSRELGFHSDGKYFYWNRGTKTARSQSYVSLPAGKGRDLSNEESSKKIII